MALYLDEIAQMTENRIPNLDRIVLAALELFIEADSFSLPESSLKLPVVIGSGNAKNTIQIIYDGKNALFADENNYMSAMDREWVDGVIIYSASGGKHAPIIAQYALSKNLDTSLVTCSKDSPAGKLLPEAQVTVTPKNPEPYTYNTSTYMGWILANTRENPCEILNYIEQMLDPIIPQGLDRYTGFLFALPNQFANVSPLIDMKFTELFGRHISRDIKTFEQLRHAVTVVPSEKELCVQFGPGELYFQGDILHIPVPENLGPAGCMAIGYYIVGKIQEQSQPYFKEHIGKYIAHLNGSEFGKGLGVIV